MTPAQDETLKFIANCARARQVYWTYHSNMRLTGRGISRELVLDGLQNARIVELYQQDIPLPSCLCLIRQEQNTPVHVVVALDKANHHIRIVTVYKPDPKQWNSTFTRRAK